jgi:hypothetical protein
VSKRLPHRSILLSGSYTAVVLLAFALSFVAQTQRNAVASTPHVTVWAWERDEDLSYIDPAEIDVAYFAGNIYVHGSLVSFRPRTQKLKLPKNAKTIPVFRIETIRRSSVSVQVDFDALEDERPFYKTLLRNLRQELEPSTKISITALASWLLADRWIERGSADEAVVMLFSIGPG